MYKLIVYRKLQNGYELGEKSDKIKIVSHWSPT